MSVVIEKLAKPRFCEGQIVEFIGGVGIITNRRFDSGSWSYLIKMEMGLEPQMGRIGDETTILLFEAELTLLRGNNTLDLLHKYFFVSRRGAAKSRARRVGGFPDLNELASELRLAALC